jgi:uncharacterized BrkB/YihY/UPF0761 family membrane protein
MVRKKKLRFVVVWGLVMFLILGLAAISFFSLIQEWVAQFLASKFGIVSEFQQNLVVVVVALAILLFSGYKFSKAIEKTVGK